MISSGHVGSHVRRAVRGRVHRAGAVGVQPDALGQRDLRRISAAVAASGARAGGLLVTLLAPAKVVLWGNGCLNAPRTIFAITPVADGWRIEIEIAGVQIFDRTAPTNFATGALALDAAQAAETLEALLADHRPRRATTARELSMTGIGTIYLTLPLATGAIDVRINDREPDRLIAVGDVLVELVRRAGLPADDLLHPVPAELR